MDSFHPVALDLTDSDSIVRALTTAEAEAGGFDVLINNAGSGHFGPTEFMPQEMLRADFQLELGDSKVRFIDLQPADIRTPFNDATVRFAADAPGYQPKMKKAWLVIDKNMRGAPGPELVARRVAELLRVDNPPPQVTVGDVFQSRVAPLLLRFLPMRVQRWGLRKYYGI